MRKQLAGAQFKMSHKNQTITMVCFDENAQEFAELVLTPAFAKEVRDAFGQAITQLNPLLLVGPDGKAL